MAEDYEILPHQVLEDLKNEVEALKKKLSAPDAKAQELILEIEGLKDSIHDLYELFQKALDQSKGDDVTTTIRTLKEKVEAVVKQNETIARALLSISEKLDKVQQQPLAAPPSMMASPMAMAPPVLPGQRMAPRPLPQEMTMDLPPPPPRKKSLFP